MSPGITKSLLITRELIFLSTENPLEKKNRTKSGLLKQNVLEQYGGGHRIKGRSPSRAQKEQLPTSWEKEQTDGVFRVLVPCWAPTQSLPPLHQFCTLYTPFFYINIMYFHGFLPEIMNWSRTEMMSCTYLCA